MEIRGLDSIVSKLAAKAADGSARPSKEAADTAKARKACREFESILLYRMLSTMRKAFQDDDQEDSGFGGEIFKSMMDEQLSLALARSGGIGLASMLEKALGIESESAPPRPGKEVSISPARTWERYVPSPRKQGAGEASSKAAPAAGIEPEKARPGGILKIYDSTIRAASQVFGVSADLIRAVIIQESGGDPKAVSHKGAKGLMQLTDPTARELGVTDPFDPVQNIFGGTRFLAKMLKTFKGNIELALASYNAGPGAVETYGGVPPYKETQNYVKGVLGKLETLRAP
jgi:soluble lytic murein transglycosylase-like protein